MPFPWVENSCSSRERQEGPTGRETVPKNTERRRCVHKNAHAVHTAQGQALWRSLLNRPKITAEQMHILTISYFLLRFEGVFIQAGSDPALHPRQRVLVPLLPRVRRRWALGFPSRGAGGNVQSYSPQ